MDKNPYARLFARLSLAMAMGVTLGGAVVDSAAAKQRVLIVSRQPYSEGEVATRLELIRAAAKSAALNDADKRMGALGSVQVSAQDFNQTFSQAFSQSPPSS